MIASTLLAGYYGRDRQACSFLYASEFQFQHTFTTNNAPWLKGVKLYKMHLALVTFPDIMQIYRMIKNQMEPEVVQSSICLQQLAYGGLK